jgi:putative radical SAM enzyme (TIGR03279 family)
LIGIAEPITIARVPLVAKERRVHVIGLSDPFTIARVEPGSLAESLGLQPGERLLAVNDVELHDEIDFNGAINEESLVVRVLAKDGTTREVEGAREYGIPFGAEFEARQPKRCHNNCVFCFVYQHPKGVRRELLIKDDDYVFSFVHANFITLTNLSEPDFQRILDERLSPLYVSVHATDPAVRVRLMKNPKSGMILQQIDRLAAAGIEIHTQLVICPGLNDGAVLIQSIEELAQRHPAVQTISVVPVGLTKHRERLPQLRLLTRDEAIETIELVHRYQKSLLREKKTRLVFAADELYVLAGQEVPPGRAYEGFPQYENGIGMLRDLIDRWGKGLDDVRARNGKRERVAIVTGTSAAPTLRRLLAERRPAEVDASLCVVTNDYFGDTVTVSGLLTGADIEAALLRERSAGAFDRVLLPPNCLKEEELFLDDRTRSDLAQRLGVPVDIGWDASDAKRRAPATAGPFKAQGAPAAGA